MAHVIIAGVLQRELNAAKAQLQRKDTELEALREQCKEVTDELAWVVKDLLRLRKRDTDDRCRSWLLSSQGLSTVLAQRAGQETDASERGANSHVSARPMECCSTPPDLAVPHG
jgi:chromosome segregation ATPase